jgi:hypothetical protein
VQRKLLILYEEYVTKLSNKNVTVYVDSGISLSLGSCFFKDESRLFSLLLVHILTFAYRVVIQLRR